jgi:ribonucleoside-diphosphate reductase alpha chain
MNIVPMSSSQLRVIKRDGSFQDVSYDKIVARLSALANETPAGLPKLLNVNPTLVAQKVINQIYDGIHTHELDHHASRVSVELTTTHPEYGDLAGRIAVSNHQKQTTGDPISVLRELHELYDDNGELAPLISEETMAIAEEYADQIREVVDYSKDYLIDYFGFKTLERAYLLKSKGRILERPQDMWVRVAIGIHGWNLDDILRTYKDLSLKYYTHATPTLFNAGTVHPQMSSCFLVAMKDDSIDGIFQTARECALISKWGGGIGLHLHNVRAKGSYIRGTSGTSNGIVPMLRVFNATARYCDQGGGRRKGSFAMYIEPWHADIEDFLRLKINFGNEEERARDLFYGLWIPDLFMKRVRENGKWTLFCPDRAKGLSDCYGDEFEALYEHYEEDSEKYGGREMSAQKLWFQILQSQIETGTPYLLYKDAANSKSNQKNLGTIKSSNLCTEIIEYSSADETAVCNLASMNLQAFLMETQTGSGDHIPSLEFDFDLFRKSVSQVVKNLDRVIDRNFYPTEPTKKSNFRHRPVGIGVQGFADVCARLEIAYDSKEARDLNEKIFAHMYYASVNASANLVQVDGLPAYETFKGSPMSKGILQPDMWDTEHTPDLVYPELDWKGLREKVKGGIRNSLLVAPMPTASTSQILGNTESFEPGTTNIYTRRTLAGEFIVVNRYLVRELAELGIWGQDIKDQIVASRGSVQNITEIPEDIRARYKTVWELSQKILIDMAADRGKYVCQSQSLNLYSSDPTFKKLSSMHFYAWGKGLKTGIYYLRTRAIADAQQFTIEAEKTNTVKFKPEEQEQECEVCSA